MAVDCNNLTAGQLLVLAMDAIRERDESKRDPMLKRKTKEITEQRRIEFHAPTNE
jgi:hypothetical protein